MLTRRNQSDCGFACFVLCLGAVAAHRTSGSPVFRLALATCLALAANTVSQIAAADSPARFQADRVIVFGDVHGAYDQLVRLLRVSGVVNEDLAWAAGTTHVVSLGDILDRGQGARPAMDLLMRLQGEAQAAGGRLHVVLGNHELMNLIGDLRYVPDAEFASFAANPSTTDNPVDTDSGAAADSTGIDPSRKPGYNERYDAFAPDGIYGRWLLAQPAALVVNDTAFVHGGLPPVAATRGPAELDQTTKARLTELLELRDTLASAGVIDPRGDIQANAARLEAERAPPAGSAVVPASGAPAAQPAAAPSTPALPAEVETKVARFIELAKDDLLGDGGPLWYRGTALCHDLLERPVVEAALTHWQARRVVVGHTPTWDSRVRARFGGLAILADTGMLYEYYRGQPAALVIEGDRAQVLYADNPGSLEAPDPRAGLEFDRLDTASVERVLASGLIARQPAPTGAPPASAPAIDTLDENGATAADLTATLPPETTLVTVSEGDTRVTALFEPGSRAEVDRQLSAYRLDRLLGLGLAVPVAEREFDGKRGVVSARWTNTIDEQARSTAKLARRNWCSTGNDYQLMYVFDALINNRGRTPNNMLYDRRTWQFASAGHANAFGRGRELPPYLANAPKVVPPGLADALRRLDGPALEEALGGSLPKAQVRALLQRRDDLLGTWTTGAAQP